LYGDGTTEPLSLKLENLNRRKEHLSSCNSMEMFERIWNGGMPGYRSGRFTDRDVFYSSYIQTYINRDVSDMIPGVDKLLFADFIRAAACRVGQMLNTHDIAQDVAFQMTLQRGGCRFWKNRKSFSTSVLIRITF
jgi:predicted AAA+ superfamily ATPase